MAIPVSLEDARRQIQLDEDDSSQDADLQRWIADAAAWVEDYTGHILDARDVTEAIRVPGRVVALRAWPIKATAVPILLDPSQAPFAGARVDVSTRPARILPALGTRWPIWRTDDYLTITLRAGYEAADAVPGNFRRAMLILISAYDSDREGGDIFQKAEATARSLCRSFRFRGL